MKCVLIGIISFAAVFFSALSGCGSGFITLPAWLMLGYPLPVALAGDKVSSCLWTPVAAKNYLAASSVRWKTLLPMTVIGILGSMAAAFFVVRVDEAVMRPVIGAVILLALLASGLNRGLGIEESPRSSGDGIMRLLAFPFGYYEGFFGAGNGIFTSYAFARIKGFSLTTSLGNYYLMAFVWSLCALAVLVTGGFYDIPLFLSASSGAVAGGYLGSRVGSTRGSAFVKKAYLILGAVLGVKLLLGY